MKFSEFSAPLRIAFIEEERRVRIANSKGGCWLAIVLMPAGYSLDAGLYPEKALLFLKLRLLCALLVGGVLVVLYTKIGRRFYKVLSQIWYILPLMTLCWIIYASNGYACPHYLGLYIVLLAVGLMLPWTYQENIFAGALVTTMYVVACWLHGPHPLPEEFKSHLYFLILTDIIVITGSFFQERIRLSEFVLRFELNENKQMLEESNRKLVEVDQIKNQFFANISHELRTPLTLLIAPLEMLRSEKAHLLDQEAQDVLKTMQENAMRLLKLINDLLDIVRLESGRVEVRKEPLKIEEFIRGVVLSVQGAARDKRVMLSANIQEGLGTVLADRDMLEKILLNLIFNSVKFTPSRGKVEISAIVKEGFLFLKVLDTGMGISEQDLPHIFDRFWQADASAQRKYQGTGIGLSLVKELTEVQGGTVAAESQFGKGTTITVRIPVEKTSEVIGPDAQLLEQKDSTLIQSEEWLTKLYHRAELFPAITSLASTLRPDEFGKGRGPKVLIADDEPDMLRFLKTQMEKYYEVLEAVDGKQAVEKARQFLPDLIILDMMMPEMDGIEACKKIRDFSTTQAIPIILLTARADDATKLEALNAGASDFLTKPFSNTELHVRVKNLVESYQYQRDLSRQKSALESTLEQLKETEGQLVQNEKMASLGRLSAGIIHEINNPLNYAHSALHVLRMKKDILPQEDREKYAEVVADIEEGIGRVERIVSDLRTFTHPKFGGAVDSVELEKLISTALRFLSHELKDKVRVDLKIPKEQMVMADQNKLIQIFVNLFQNAVDALKEKEFDGEEPLLSIQSRLEDDKVLVNVRDNGAGIAQENLDKIFDPFFTTKDVGQGMGLGLSLCYRLINDQGGSITVKSEQGKFTEFQFGNTD